MITFAKLQSDEHHRISDVFKGTKVLHVLKPQITEAEYDSYYKTLAQKVGKTIIYEEDPITGEIRPNHWTKIEYIAGEEENTYKHSNYAQPLHTDYGYFSFEIFCSFFYCEKQAEFGGATTFIDVDDIVSVLQSTNTELLEKLLITKIHFGRKDNPLAHNDDFILQKDEIGWKINWNYYRAKEDKTNSYLVEEFKSFLDTYIEKSGELINLKLQPGEAVFFHDRRILHGRNSFVGKRILNKGAIATFIPEEVIKLL